MSEEESCRNFATKTQCPLCHEEMSVNWQGDEIPYFGEVMYIASLCTCGFRFADTMILSQRDPMRFELNVDGLDDLNSRVIRSTSGTIRIPELGIDVEPGSISDSYVTNIEGLLDRILQVVVSATRWAEQDGDEDKRLKGEEIQQIFEDVMSGNRPITVIIEDPFGNSAIISDKVKFVVLSSEEAEKLKTGMIVFDSESSDVELDASDSEYGISN